MTDLNAAQKLIAAAMAAREGTEDPEIVSVRQLLKLLDKASKNVRTFGQTNPVAQRFFQQFYEALNTHFSTYHSLSLLIQRSELFFQDQSVYGTTSDSSTENLAFRLYSDGIRELTIQAGISEEDVLFFLDALWGNKNAAADDDDDIVTRLWERNLTTITLVTANEVMKLSDVETILTPQQQTSLNAPTSSLKDVVDQEKNNQKKETDKSRASTFKSGVTGYEISDGELSALFEEVQAETGRDVITYLLDILTAILASEQSPELITELLGVYEGLIESLLRQGQWSLLEHILCLLLETNVVRPDLSDEHTEKLKGLLQSLGTPERIKTIEHYLVKTDNPTTDGLQTILAMMPPPSVGPLCALMGNVTNQAHQAIIADALASVAKEYPDPLIKSLSDRRPTLVRPLLGIIARWNNPQHADAVEKIIRYPDAAIRREVIRTIGVLRPNGNGVKLVPLLNDPDEGVRLAAFNLLLTGNYTAPYTVWEPLVTAEEFADRPPAERRNIFHAMRATCGDEAVAYWTGLLTDRGWTNRKKREELALLAVDALGKLSTPAALAALQLGLQKGGPGVKQAAAAAFAAASKPRAKAS
jgi:hypothetical protein